MTKRAVRSVGTKLRIGTNFISDLSSIGSPSITQEELDVTTLDSEGGYREFIAGFKDPGEVAVSGFFVPSDAGQAAVYAALESGDIQNFEIIYPPQLGASWSFQGIVTAFNVTSETEEAIGFEATIRVSGKPRLNLEPSSGLTNITVNGEGGVLSPSFDPDTYFYTFSGVTASSFSVTATGSDHTMRLYVDDQYVQDLESGQPSSAISFGSQASRKVSIIAQESGKVSVVYEIVVIAA